MSGCNRELFANFYSTVSLKYHACNIILTFNGPVPTLPSKSMWNEGLAKKTTYGGAKAMFIHQGPGVVKLEHNTLSYNTFSDKTIHILSHVFQQMTLRICISQNLKITSHML